MDVTSKTKALFLSYDGMTDPLGQSQVLPYLAGLVKKGIEIHLISFEKTEVFEKNKEIIQSICGAGNIHWYPENYTKKPPLLSTIWDVQKMRRKARSLHKVHQFEIIHCRSYISALVGIKMKRDFGTKFLFDMRGFWADERVDGRIWNLKNPIFKTVFNYFKRKEIEFFKTADAIISLTENGKNEILSWEKLKNENLKIKVIPCCVNLDLFNPENYSDQQKQDLKVSLNLSNENYVLGYIGSIGTWYMLPEMLDFFKELKKEKETAKFLFISGENPETIIKLAKEKNISPKDILVKSCMHKEVPLAISILDASIFFIKPSYSKKASSPTKQGELMAMGIPLICNTGVGDTDQIVRKYESGNVIETFTNDAYFKALFPELNFSLEKTQNGAEAYFSLSNGVENYFSVYTDLIHKSATD